MHPSTIPELAEDFKKFLFAVWDERRWEPSAIQYKAADFLQAEGSDRKIFSAMRGFGKTELTAAYVCWCGYRNSDISILIISATLDVACDIVGLVKALVENTSFLKHMRPKGRAAGDKDSATRFDFGHKENFRKDSSVVARGIRSQITGLHPDLVIADDCETPENGMTEGGRLQTLAKYGEFEDVLNPGGKVISLGTPQTELSLYFTLSDLEAYEMIRVPAEYPNPNSELSMKFLAPWLTKDLEEGRAEPGQPTNPGRMDSEYLLDKKATQGQHRYALQMLLDPSLASHDLYPLKLSDFIVWDVAIDVAPQNIVWGTSKPREDLKVPSVVSKDGFYEPIFYSNDFVPYQDSVMYVDPSGKGKDETAAVVGKRCGGHIYVCEVFGTTGSHDDRTLLQLVQLVNKWEVKRVVVEENFGGEVYGKLLQSKLQQAANSPVQVTTKRVGNKQKELRIIDIAEPLMNQHRVVLNSSVAKNTVFLYQLCRLTRERGSLDHDDRVDAYGGMLNELSDVASVNIDDQIEKQRMAQIKAVANEWDKKAKQQPTFGTSIKPSPSRGSQKRSKGFSTKGLW